MSTQYQYIPATDDTHAQFVWWPTPQDVVVRINHISTDIQARCPMCVRIDNFLDRDLPTTLDEERTRLMALGVALWCDLNK